jgi:putative hydrolase of the HAD superfamily
VHQIKPAPDLFLKAQELLKLQKDELLVFEDSQNGILAATRAGMRVVAVPNPITAHDTHEGASLLLNSLADEPLEDLLKQFTPT